MTVRRIFGDLVFVFAEEPPTASCSDAPSLPLESRGPEDTGYEEESPHQRQSRARLPHQIAAATFVWGGGDPRGRRGTTDRERCSSRACWSAHYGTFTVAYVAGKGAQGQPQPTNNGGDQTAGQ